MDDSYEAVMPRLWRRTKMSIFQNLRDWQARLKSACGQERKELAKDISEAEAALKGINERLSKPVRCMFPNGPFRQYSKILEEEERKKREQIEAEREEQERQAEEEFRQECEMAAETGEEPPPRKLRTKGRRHSALTFLGE